MGELAVSLSIMTIFLAVTTTAFLQLYGMTNATEAMSTAQSQATIAFLRLDTEIRYAAGISTPARVNNNWYVEYVTTVTGTARCTELRLAAGQLQRRSWPLNSTPGAFVPLASGVAAGASTNPFVLVSPDTSINHQRLGINLTVSARARAGSRQVNVVFTALNSSAASEDAANSSPPLKDAQTCADIGRAAP